MEPTATGRQGRKQKKTTGLAWVALSTTDAQCRLDELAPAGRLRRRDRGMAGRKWVLLCLKKTLGGVSREHLGSCSGMSCVRRRPRAGAGDVCYGSMVSQAPGQNWTKSTTRILNETTRGWTERPEGRGLAERRVDGEVREPLHLGTQETRSQGHGSGRKNGGAGDYRLHAASIMHQEY
ncbi:hypothetical protein IWZ01DRAFT_277723 [Phyllosticta capitalensis]